MANRFSDIAKQMGAKVNEDAKEEKNDQENQAADALTSEETSTPEPSKKASLKKAATETKGATTRKTTAIPLVLDIAIKEVKERRNIASKFRKTKKITEDDVVVEALELYFKKAENRSYLEAAYQKLQFFAEGEEN